MLNKPCCDCWQGPCHDSTYPECLGQKKTLKKHEYRISQIINKQGTQGIVRNVFKTFIEVEVPKYGTIEFWMIESIESTEIKKPLICLSKDELDLLLSVPSSYDILYAKMIAEQHGTKERRNEILHYSDVLRHELGL